MMQAAEDAVVVGLSRACFHRAVYHKREALSEIDNKPSRNKGSMSDAAQGNLKQSCRVTTDNHYLA